MSHNVNDLLKLIGKDSSESEPFDSIIGQFIEKFNLKSNSEVKVENSIIWYTYKKVFGGELSKIAFFRELSKHFSKKRTGKKRFYCVGGDFDLSREGLILAEHFNRNEK